jgi:hypothetical protein
MACKVNIENNKLVHLYNKICNILWEYSDKIEINNEYKTQEIIYIYIYIYNQCFVV